MFVKELKAGRVYVGDSRIGGIFCIFKINLNNFDSYSYIFAYFYKFTHVTYDWFCGPWSQI